MGAVERGTFREALFFRINVVQLEVPPLRVRGNDLLLRNRTFALIVSDLRLPSISGLQAVAYLRRHDQETPVLLITAFGDQGTRSQAHRLGVGGVLDKPFELEQFRAAVHRLTRSP